MPDLTSPTSTVLASAGPTSTGPNASNGRVADGERRQAQHLTAKALRQVADDISATSTRIEDAIGAGYLRLASAILTSPNPVSMVAGR
ncbi:hypothetical protein GCG21_09095 [Pseudactinotalea sp. HY160]|uniref:hypothetical protein n=1 Tax=Pseudactinotalea sp. HY160 TaxID=2654490 RepID=UPI00128E4E11|nr:hypothetical protein [Pseudactinotalea sp. HY160]MPV50158.1 hypothetical protein [Pseudactinotalea sp. HY160]